MHMIISVCIRTCTVDIYLHVPAITLKPCTCDKLVHMSVLRLFDDKMCARDKVAYVVQV